MLETWHANVPIDHTNFDVELTIALRGLLLVRLNCPSSQPTDAPAQKRSQAEAQKTRNSRSQARAADGAKRPDHNLVPSSAPGISF